MAGALKHKQLTKFLKHHPLVTNLLAQAYDSTFSASEIDLFWKHAIGLTHPLRHDEYHRLRPLRGQAPRSCTLGVVLLDGNLLQELSFASRSISIPGVVWRCYTATICGFRMEIADGLDSLSRVKTLVESDSPVTRARATVPSGLDHFGGISQALRNAVCVPPLRSKQYLKTTFRSPFSAHARAAAASLPRTKNITTRLSKAKPHFHALQHAPTLKRKL